jgi:hypothetical protein
MISIYYNIVFVCVFVCVCVCVVCVCVGMDGSNIRTHVHTCSHIYTHACTQTAVKRVAQSEMDGLATVLALAIGFM